jgi:CubicO group peptidase (beta-lactamase class C family)
LVEVVTGERFETVVRKRVLDVVSAPSDREEASLGFEIPHGRHATGYTRRWSGLGLFISLLPDAAKLRSTEGGWIRYRPFHLNGAAYGGLKGNVLGWAPLLTAITTRSPALLPAASWNVFFQAQALGSGAPSGHALAWFTGAVDGHSYLCHAGGGPGYYAEIRVYPGLGAASALLVNTTFVDDRRLLDRLDRPWLPSGAVRSS